MANDYRQNSVLLDMYDNGQRIYHTTTEIAKRLGVTGSAVCSALQRLQAKGLVERYADLYRLNADGTRRAIRQYEIRAIKRAQANA